MSIHAPVYKAQLPVPTDVLPQYVKKYGIHSMEIRSHSISSKGKRKEIKYSSRYQFDEAGHLTEILEMKNGQQQERTTYTYYADGYVASMTEYDKNDEVKVKNVKQYRDVVKDGAYYSINGDGDTLYAVYRGSIKDNQSVDRYYKKGKLKNRWVNEYYDDLSLKKSSLYNGKGKLKYVWDYQCKTEGVEVLKHKDTTKYCTEQSTDKDGIRTVVYHKVGEDGTLFKMVNKLNRANKLVYYKKTEGPEEKPVWYQETDYYDNDTLIKNHYAQGYFKGKLNSRSEMAYDSTGNEIKNIQMSYNKGKLKAEYVRTYTYDAFHRPLTRTYDNKTKGSKRVLEYTYLN